MRASRIRHILPDWKSAALALLAAVLLILAFPNFELWWTAWFALVPLMFAVEREKESAIRSFLVGWLFGTVFFYGTCWWLTFAPITYAGFPPLLAYSLFFIVTAIVGLCPAIFAAILAVLLRRFGSWAFLAAPFIWVFTEFLRYWLTGNNWNAIGYSQAPNEKIVALAAFGGVCLVSGQVVVLNTFYGGFIWVVGRFYGRAIKGIFSNASAIRHGKIPGMIDTGKTPSPAIVKKVLMIWLGLIIVGSVYSMFIAQNGYATKKEPVSSVVAIQPNVPMSGLDYYKWGQLRQHQIDTAESEVKKLRTTNNELPTTVILPESPMNFQYEDDREFRDFINGFARRNNVSVLFNSAEPDRSNGKYFNSAVMIDAQGRKVAEYDKIYLLPFGEAVPVPFESLVPAFVGSFSYGRNYDLLPLGDAKAGVMICFESHFGQLARRFVGDGADVLIEMTNDGYLGPTPVLRQHLANAVFRAVETNRPVLRVTNVGVTAYINERGEVLDPAPTYAEDTRVWSVSKSDGSQTFYVRYGDWFAWLCSVVTIGLLILGMRRKIRHGTHRTTNKI